MNAPKKGNLSTITEVDTQAIGMSLRELPPELIESLADFIDQLLLNPWILIALILAATQLVKAWRKGG